MTSSDQCKVLAYLVAISMSDDRVRTKYPFGYSIYYLQLYRRCQLFRIIGHWCFDIRRGLQGKREDGRVGETGGEDEPTSSQRRRQAAERAKCGAGTIKL